MASTVARTCPDNYKDFVWKVHYPAIYSAIQGSGVQLDRLTVGKKNVNLNDNSSLSAGVHRGAVAAVMPATLPYAKNELCMSLDSVHMSVLTSIFVTQPTMIAPFPAILDEVKSAVISELSAHKAALAKDRHNKGCDVPLQPLLSACRKGINTIRSKVAKPLEQQRILWRGVTEAALAFGWCHEDGEVVGKSFVLQVLASNNSDYAGVYSSTGSDFAVIGSEGSNFRRQRGVADKELVKGFKAEFSPLINEIFQRQQLKKFKKLMTRLSELRIGDLLKADDDPVQSLKGVHRELTKHHMRLRAIFRYYCRLGSNTVPGEKPISYLGNVSAAWKFWLLFA